ncbi:MAG: serine/threonine protein kinase [Proteobacteria bacterium]|nr:serine/threonine protein kinase [Pseudomonadota bacterium]MCP4916001.1 serine/threonine protein kinase [Pseudomonadota bacterium]
MSELEGKLTQLKRLLELGLIDEADFAVQKRALLTAGLAVAPPLAGATSVASPLSGSTQIADGALPERLGSYVVLGELGAGGMGRVVRARHVEEGWARRQGGDVAIKLIQPQIASEPGFRERFFAEAELGRKVSHASVASVFDVVADGDHLACVMSLVEGRDLTEFVRPGGMPLDEVLALLRPLAQALDHLHGLGIIHRDLKPANVKVRADGTPVLLDLGIAKDMGQDDGLTHTSTAMGTLEWMAPEQMDAKHAGPAADRYALGLIAYALLSGRMPWGDESSPARVHVRKLTGDLTPLGKIRPDLAGALSEAVGRMTALEPSRRPSSSARFVQDLASARAAPKSKRAEPKRTTPEPKQPAPKVPDTTPPLPPPLPPKRVLVDDGFDEPPSEGISPMWFVGGAVLLVGGIGAYLMAQAPREAPSAIDLAAHEAREKAAEKPDKTSKLAEPVDVAAKLERLRRQDEEHDAEAEFERSMGAQNAGPATTLGDALPDKPLGLTSGHDLEPGDRVYGWYPDEAAGQIVAVILHADGTLEAAFHNCEVTGWSGGAWSVQDGRIEGHVYNSYYEGREGFNAPFSAAIVGNQLAVWDLTLGKCLEDLRGVTLYRYYGSSL